MIFRFIKLVSIIISFILLTGFFPLLTLLGPGITVATSGSVYKAGAQYIVNKSIKDTTGKNSFAFIKEKIEKKDNKNYRNQQLMRLVERRIELARKRLNLKNINQ